ncbi:MAG: TRAP transporter small permease [Reyranella sp.]|uniref:TRAP transporter small permease subunit n=1 Tax=Reyranella sp. TaxID=1929291 RepID=UPI002730C556|nr:TRAP transporter small permease [Reyranella sp.]MDP1962541.1 TRAP transporter small permease [Reyranella sp.]MDP2373285.1 TRAP transporter small permease [Reyranella sp.]
MTVHPERAMGGAVLDRLDRALQVVEFATAVVGGVVIFGVMWVGVAEIFLRKAFNAPLYGQLDLIEQTMATYTLLTISYCYRKAGHIRVEILVGHFKGRNKWIAELIASTAAFGLIVVLLPGVLHFFENAYYIGDSTINTQWPTWPSKLVPVIGFSVLAVRIFLEMWAYVRLIADPLAEPIAVPVPAPIVEDA